MKGVSQYFMVLAVCAVVLGMSWGIQMSISGDHSLFPAHAHLNLIGWVSMSIFAIYYHLVPEAGQAMLARVHFALAAAGLILIVPGIAMAIRENGEGLAKAGSVLTLLSMLVFLVTVVRHGKRGD